VRGLDYSDAALAMCRDRGLEVRKFDLEGDTASIDWKADLAISTKVAEHLPERCANDYVGLLSLMATRFVVMTAARPGQGGTDHVNEQPNEYWIGKFETCGLSHRLDLTESFRKDWRDKGVDMHRASNVMVFQVQ
jgi:hypothetical protein